MMRRNPEYLCAWMFLSLPLLIGCRAIQEAAAPGGIFDAVAVTVGTLTGSPVVGGGLKAVGALVGLVASAFVVKKTHTHVKKRIAKPKEAPHVAP